MDTDKLKAINRANADNQLSTQRHNDLINSSVKVSNTVLSATASLIQYIEGHIQKSEVINQLESIATPDALEVIPYIEALHATLKTHKNTDLTELTKLMSQMVDEAKKIPKDLPKTEKQQFVDYSDQFKALKEAITAVGQFVKDQKTVVEAPVVHVDAPNINIPPTDLKPLQKDIKGVVDAIKKIVIPEYKTDNVKVEGLITKSNKLLKELIEKPISRGGGGGGIVSYVNSAGLATPVTLTATGKVPVDATITATIDPAGLATSTIQTNGTQKSQLVDAGGEAATVTGGKLDVNATVDTTGLALEAGNLASIKAKTDNIPAQGQALATGSLPVVLTAAQVTTLTPPAAITGFSTETTLSALNTKVPSGLTVTANRLQVELPAGGSGLTDTELRATPVPVSGTVTTGGLTDTQLRASAVPISLATAPTTPVTGTFWQATQPVSGTVTANAGTNLNTSALATEAGNLASIKAKTDNIPALGQALAAASIPVILPTATITTLTPPAAITGFATEAKQLADGHSVALSATDNAVLDVIAAKDFATQTTLAAVNAKMVTGTDIGDVTINNATGASAVNIQDGGNTITVDGTVAVTNADITTIAGAVSATHMQVDVLTAPSTAVTNAGITTIAGAVAGTEMQVDVLTMPTVTVNAHAVTNAGTFAVQTTSAITGIGHGVKVVTTAGTDVVLAASTACKRVIIQAQTDNTSLIAVGGSGVDATIATGTGIILNPGDAFEMDIDNLTDVYIDSLVNGEGCRFTYWT